MGLSSVKYNNEKSIAWLRDPNEHVDREEEYYQSLLFSKNNEEQLLNAGIITQNDLKNKKKLTEMYKICAMIEESQTHETQQSNVIRIENEVQIAGDYVKYYLSHRNSFDYY